MLGLLFSIVVDVKVNILQDTLNFWWEPPSFFRISGGYRCVFVIVPATTMSQFKGKELIRRLAWLVYQDQEHYHYQLEKAVSVPLGFYLQRTFSSVCCILNF